MNIRVTGLCVYQGKILLIKQPFDDLDRAWSLPGGKIEEGESLGSGVIREVKEETGIDVSVKRLLYISDNISSNRHIIHILFECEYVGGDVGKELNLTLDEKQKNSTPDFMPLEELSSIGFSDLFIAKIKSGFPDAGSYVGSKKNIGL